MKMITKKRFWWGALASVAGLLFALGNAQARVLSISPDNPDPGITTDTSAGIVVYPKIKVLTACSSSGNDCTSDSDCATTETCKVVGDTMVQLTNTSLFLTKAHCFYVNANGHCSNAASTVCNDVNVGDVCPSGGTCVPGWQETDFRLTLTKRQPISWSVNDGLPELPLNNQVVSGQSNEGSIPPVPEVPFTGELRCIQVDVTNQLPIDRNDLKGEATIVATAAGEGSSTIVDPSKYTAIGLPAIGGNLAQVGTNSAQLNIGGSQANYNGCPNILTLNHFFEDASVTTHNGSFTDKVNSTLTVVPCAADFLNQDQNPASAVLQFLIYNEFEQRFSTSTRITCYREVRLADIDTKPGTPGNAYSIFSASVQGTLVGQSRIRAVSTDDGQGFGANGVLALLQENWAAGGNVATDIANVQFQGTRSLGDQMIIPVP